MHLDIINLNQFRPPTNHTTIRQLADNLFGNQNQGVILGFEKILREARDLDVPRD